MLASHKQTAQNPCDASINKGTPNNKNINKYRMATPYVINLNPPKKNNKNIEMQEQSDHHDRSCLVCDISLVLLLPLVMNQTDTTTHLPSHHNAI
jgi:hypothetical protein